MSVVKLSEVAAAPRGSPRPEAPGILAECRDIVVERLCASMSGALKKVESDLFKKLESTAMSADELRLYAEAQRQLNMIKADLDQRFRAVFQRSFNLRAARPEQANDPYSESSEMPLELSLVDEDQVSEEVAFQNVALQMRSRCDTELSELGTRLAYLFGQQQISDEQDPLGPNAICKVLKDMCWQLESTKPVKLIILDRLSGSLGEDVAKLYKELNAHLVKRQVLPRVRHSVRRSKSGLRPAGDAAGASATHGDLLADLEQMLAARAGGGTSPGGIAQGSLSGSELMDVLTRFQHGEAGLPAGLDAVVVSSEDGLHNVLHSLKDSSLGRQVSPFDGLMIDIVATMFDYIFEDPRVPATVKGLIARLQIPLLKVAMADRSFFSSKAHPARRFLNALAAMGSEWGEQITGDSRLYLKAESLVLRIQQEFESDLGVFVESLRELEATVAEEQRLEEERAIDMAGELEQRERRDIASAVAASAIEPYMSEASLPQAVKAFLTSLWAPILAQAHVEGGEAGLQWTGAIATMDDLVWSVRPKHGSDARKLLVQRLPILLKQLRLGLDSTGTPAEEREKFFSQLVGLHAAAVKAGMNAPAPAPTPTQAPAVPPDREAAADTPAAADRPASVVVAAAAAKLLGTQEATELDALVRGVWVEFGADTDETVRARLTWVSPARTMFLFTNRQGQRALALTSKELLAKFDNAAARIVDDTPLIDRVVESVLESIQLEDSSNL